MRLDLSDIRDENDDDDDIPVVSLGLEELALGKKRFIVGLALAILSTLFIGSSFIIKKIGLIRLSQRGSLRASSGGYAYLKDWVWWADFLCMGIGELFNFIAYAFAPASLVTPLRALSVLVTALLAAKFLKEELNLFTVTGCINCIFGLTVIVLHAPKEGQIKSLEQLNIMLTEPLFILYLLFVLLVSSILIGLVSPKYGEKNVLVYIAICSLIGSLSVMACKGFGLAITEALSGTSNGFKTGLFWFLLLSVIATITTQMNYFNKSLDIFDATVVIPIYYVFFTTLVLIASSILYQEWLNMKFEDLLGAMSGFVIVITGVFLINFFKYANIGPLNLSLSPTVGSNLHVPLLKSQSPTNSASQMNFSDANSDYRPSQRKKRRGMTNKSLRHEILVDGSSSDETDEIKHCS